MGFQSTTFADTENNNVSVTAMITNGVTVGSAFSVQLAILPSSPLSAVANRKLCSHGYFINYTSILFQLTTLHLLEQL